MAKEENLGIGIDFGTTNLLVYVKGHGVIFDEPSVVAFDVESGDVIAGGKDACSMIGKTHDKIAVSRPLREGVISDMDAATALLKFALQRVETIRDYSKSSCLICCPSEVSQIERDALKDLAEQMGIQDALIEQEIKSGALGSGLDIYTPKAAMIIDIGGGTTDIGILSLGDVVLSQTIRIAGSHIDQEIVKYVHKNHNLIIGSGTAEKIKTELATLAPPQKKQKTFEATGRELVTGLPSGATITSQEIYELILPIFGEITNAVYTVLEQTPPELASDVVKNGVLLQGGGAMIPGIKEYFEKVLNLKVQIAPNPLQVVVTGTKVLLDNKGSYLVRPQD